MGRKAAARKRGRRGAGKPRAERFFEYLMYQVIDSLALTPQPLGHVARQLSAKTGEPIGLVAERIRQDRRVEVSERDLVYLRGAAPRTKHLTGAELQNLVFAMVNTSGPVSTSWLYSTFGGTTPFGGPQILALVKSDQRLVVDRGMVRLVPRPCSPITVSGPTAGPEQVDARTSPSDPARELRRRIIDELRRQVDELHLVCPTAERSIRLRCDGVSDRPPKQIWVTLATEDSSVIRTALDRDAVAPSEGWLLPLRAAHSGSRILVWRLDAMEAAADLILAKIAAFSCAVADVELTAVTHRSAERKEIERNVRVLARLRARPRPRSGEVLGDCAKCGHALTDPSSAAIGIGPTCQKRYAPEVIQALRTDTELLHPGVKRPKQWLRSVRGWHSRLASGLQAAAADTSA